MSYTVKKLPDEPVILATLHNDYHIYTETAQTNQEAFDILAVHEEMVLDAIIAGASTVARGETALWHHPQMHQVLLESEDPMVHRAAEGLQSEIFGNLNVALFPTLEAALAYARG